MSLITSLLVLQPSKRLTAEQVLDSLITIISTLKVPISIKEEEEEQVVPVFINNMDGEKCDKKSGIKEEDIIDFAKQITIQVKIL